MKDEILVDARGLTPPEPLDRVMRAIDSLQPGQRVRLLLHREPLALYGILEQMGFSHVTHAQPDGTFQIVIQDKEDQTPIR